MVDSALAHYDRWGSGAGWTSMLVHWQSTEATATHAPRLGSLTADLLSPIYLHSLPSGGEVEDPDSAGGQRAGK